MEFLAYRLKGSNLSCFILLCNARLLRSAISIVNSFQSHLSYRLSGSISRSERYAIVSTALQVLNKLLSISIRNDKVISKSKRRSRELNQYKESKSRIIRNANDEREFENVAFLKRQRSNLFLKSYNLKSYFEKSLKEHKK